MRGVWFRFATELRTRWAGWLALAALVGVFYGAVLAAAAGAERTDTIVARSINSKLSPDVFMVPAFSDNGELLDFESIRHFPEVERAARLPRYGDLDGYDITGFTDVSTLESTVRLLEGRLPDPANAEEVLATFVARQARGVQVGDLIQLHLSSRQDGVDGEPASAGRTRSVRVVGVAASLVDFVAVADPGLFVTPAFGVAVTGETVATDQFVFVLRHHEADLPAFRSHMTELTGGKPVFFVEAQTIYGQVKRSFHVQAEALWILAGFLVFIVLVVSTQMFARVARLEARDDATLASLGMTRRQTWAPAAFRGIFIGAIAAVVAAALAVMASLFTPFGRPRSAEPAPGVYVPLPLLAAGVLAVLLVVVVQNALPVALHRQRAHVRHARLGPLARVMPGGPAARAGFQFAIEPGRGADAIPARSGIAGLTVAVVAVLISLTAASSLTHLLATPRLYGWGWDATVQLDTAGSDATTKLEALPGVAAISYGTNAAKVLVADVTADLVSLAPGLVNPVMIEGRRPSTHDEVALAPKTASAADARIGSTVMISIQGADLQRQMHVTGITVLPVDSDDTTLGEGVLMTDTALQTLAPGVEPDIAFVRFTPDADVVRLRSDIAHVVGDESAIAVPSNPSTLVDFGRVRALPLILAGLLGFLGLATIGHVLFSTVHRRRHDLAVLSMLGFTPRELRLAILWNAVALTAVALLVGLPLGVAAGRWVWTAFARDTGFVAEPITLPLHVIGVATAVIVCALGVAWQASRGIGRASRGTTLHAE